MAKGYALAIGLNSVNKKHYEGWDGKLNVCEKDALDIAAFLKKKTISVTNLLTKEATRDNVLKELDRLAAKAVSGDLVVVYYSGHGGNEIPDLNKDEDDPWSDKFDESWCLYDAQLIDDELYFQWKKFKKGVRIIVVSDSCFSGDIVKALDGNKRKSKAMEAETGNNTWKANQKFYKSILKKLDSSELQLYKSTKTDKVRATLLQISSSQEGQPSVPESQWFPDNSLFTGVLMKAFADTKYKSYEQLVSDLKKIMPDFQTPNEQVLGDKSIKILLQSPFKI
jgi:metacaspase-1